MKLIPALLLVCILGFIFSPVLLADPVDLKGKEGVVDPRDLKKSDPPERPLPIKEPTIPERERPTGDPHRKPTSVSAPRG